MNGRNKDPSWFCMINESVLSDLLTSGIEFIFSFFFFFNLMTFSIPLISYTASQKEYQHISNSNGCKMKKC